LTVRVLALSAYPVEAAATRFRLSQYVEPLAARGIELDIRPFIDSDLFAILYERRHAARVAVSLMFSAARRLRDAMAARGAQVLLVQREAMLLGPPVIEWLALQVGRCPLVLDLDDALNVRYESPTYGRLAAALKCFGKTDDLIRWSRLVICGNRFIADYVQARGGRPRVIPTVVDTERFTPRGDDERACPVVGWVGTHSTFPFLQRIAPALERVARRTPFRLRVVGGGADAIRIPGVDVESMPWAFDREIADFQSLDVGLYPIDPAVYGAEWVAGKSGFKAIQYMAVGVPFVMSPVGICAEIAVDGVTHFAASTIDEWTAALSRLLADAELRRTMGAAGRACAVAQYSLQRHAADLADALAGVRAA